MATAAETKHVRIRRNPRGFGFTLRYYVDEGGADMGPKYSNDGRNAQLYEQHRDAIVFIKNVLSRGPADVAGLNVGDRVQGINGVSVRGKSYHEIVKVVQDSPEELDLLVVPQAVHSESFEGAGLKLKAVTAKPLFHQHQLTVEPSPLSPNAPRNRSFTTENWGFGVDPQQHPGSDTIGTRTMSANATMIRPIRLHHVIKFDNDTEEEEEESKSSSAGAGQPLSPPPSLEERKPGDGGEASPPQKQSPRRQREDYVASGNPSTERRQNLKGLGLTATPYYHAGVAAAQYPTELESPAVLFDDDDDDDEEVEEAEKPAFSRFRKAAPIVRMRSEKSAYKRGESPGQRKSSVEFRRSATVGAWERKGSVSEPTSPAGTKDVTLLKNLLGRVELSDGDDTGGTNTTNSPAVDQGYYSSRKFQFEGLVSVGSSGAGGGRASGGTREPEWKPTRHSYGSSPHPYMEAVEKSGYLRQKQTIDSNGKKAKDRSWRLYFYQLRGHMLYAFKDEKDAKAGDVAPLSIKSCRIDIAHDYQKKPNTFRLTLFNGSEFLLNTDAQDSMLSWIKAIRDNSDPDGDKQNAGRSDLIMRKAAQQEQKLADKGARNLTAKIKKKQDSLRAARRTNSLRVPRRNTAGKDGSESGSTTPTAFRRGGGSFFRRKGAGGGGHSPNLHHHDHFEEFDGDHFFRKTLSECELSLQHDNVPLLIVRCATEIEKRGLEVEGIYRIPGKKSEIRLLAEEFRRDVYNASFEDQRWGDIHSITSLLKLFLRDLTEPIFPTDMYDNFMSASKIQDDDQRLIMLKQLIQELSTLHYSTLRYIIQHLHKVASRAEFNKMYPRNLAIVFGPTLVRRHYDSMQHLVSQMGDQCKIVESLVTHCTWFFASVPEEGGKRSGIFLRPSQSGDWSILPEILDAAAFQNSSSSSKAKAPRKPRRTWEFDPTDPDTGTESSDFWIRYPPTIDHSDFSQSSSSQAAAAAAAAVAASSLASSRADSTRQWISQMSASAWQTESSASPPSSRQSRHRGSVSGIASGGTGEPVVRRQRRGRQNQWRDVTVTGSGDFSDGRLAVFRSREGEGASTTTASAAGGKGGKDSPQTTLL